MDAAKLQDMPPAGGYKKIPFARVPPKSYLTGWQVLATYGVATTLGLYVYYLNAKMIKREDIEMRSAQFVMYPILFAERDREFLKQLRRNREEEEKLMAKVPGWQVGTWYDEPVFKTLPKDKLIPPNMTEFYAHADWRVCQACSH